MNSANKVIVNTGVLYGQLIIQLVLTLITTRIVLDALGEVDYGIYMLVAGVISLLGVLNSTMANTSMRYMAHSLGKRDVDLVRKIFNTTLYIHFIIGLLVILLMEAGGWLMFEYVLNIPIGKMFEAKVIYQLMIITTFISIISVPYDAVMNAHEHIFILSIIDVLGFILNLLLAIYLLYADGFLLIKYGFYVFVIKLLLRIIKQIISKRKYEECKLLSRKYIDKKMTKEILSFTTWNLFGSLAAVATVQIRGIILNSFFGVKLNAAEGVSKNASAPVNMISSSMTRAINPLIMKSEGGGDREKMLRITILSVKYSIFLFSFFAVPVVFEAPYLLKIWLGKVPEYAVAFCQLSLVAMFVEKFTFQLTNAFRAVGRIRNFQIVESLVCFIYIPIAFYLFANGSDPIVIYILAIGTSVLCGVVRLYFSKKIMGIKILNFIKNANLPVIIPVFLSSLSCFYVTLIFQEGVGRLILSFVVSILIIFFSFIVWGTNSEEKLYFKRLLTNLKGKFA